MHISLVSPLKDSLPGIEVMQDLSDVTIDKVTTLGDMSNIEVDLIFFDAELGVENILQQYHLFLQKNKSKKWLVININNVHKSLQFIQSGASGILTSFCNKEKLQHCIQFVFEDNIYLEDDLIQALAFRQINKILVPFKQLTAREFDVFCLLAEECTIQMIAELLSITAKTAFNCQTQVRKKLALKNQQQLIQLAKKHRLVIG